MPEYAKVKPAPGTILIDFRTKMKVPKEGLRVPLVSYWKRRIADGSAIIVEESIKEVKRIVKFEEKKKTKGGVSGLGTERE